MSDVFKITRFQEYKTNTEYYRVLQSVTECYRVLQSVTECYRVLQSVTECNRMLQSVTECNREFKISLFCFFIHFEEVPRIAAVHLMVIIIIQFLSPSLWPTFPASFATSDDRWFLTFLQKTKLLPMKPYLLFAFFWPVGSLAHSFFQRYSQICQPILVTNIHLKICPQALFFQNIGLCKNSDIFIS